MIAGTRVTLFLPVNSPHETTAATRVLADISDHYHGATHSVFQPPGFRGYWVDQGTLIIDEVSLVLFDVAQREDGPALIASLDALRRSVFDAYQDAGSPQDEIWLTVHPIQRVD